MKAEACLGPCAQIAKLLIIPFVCLVEHFWLSKVFTRSVIGSVLIVVLGVGIVCVPSSYIALFCPVPAVPAAGDPGCKSCSMQGHVMARPFVVHVQATCAQQNKVL